MGIFDKWKKKPQDDAPCESILDPSVQETEEETAPVEKTAAPAVPDVRAMLAWIREKHPAAQWQGEKSLLFPCGLELTINCGPVDHYPKGCCAQLRFVMWHPFFDEDLVESVAGMGQTETDAKNDGVKAFSEGVLPFVLGALDCTDGQTISAVLQGREHIFREPCVIGTLHRGKGEAADLWKLVKEQIPQYLGTKKAYWIKLLSSRRGKDICEVRINGMVFRDLTEVLYKAISEGRSTAQGGMDKTFVLLIQDEATFTPCPFTKADAASVAQRALRKMLTIGEEISQEAVYREIQQMHPILGGEACAFLPEIFTRILYNYHASDALLPISLNIGEVRSSQVRSFGYYESAVLDFLRQYRPDSDDRVTLLRLSAEFNAINQAVAGGSQIGDLTFSPLAYTTPEDYVIW